MSIQLYCHGRIELMKVDCGLYVHCCIANRKTEKNWNIICIRTCTTSHSIFIFVHFKQSLLLQIWFCHCSDRNQAAFYQLRCKVNQLLERPSSIHLIHWAIFKLWKVPLKSSPILMKLRYYVLPPLIVFSMTCKCMRLISVQSFRKCQRKNAFCSPFWQKNHSWKKCSRSSWLPMDCSTRNRIQLNSSTYSRGI